MTNKFKCPRCGNETRSSSTMHTHLIYKHDMSPSDARTMLSPHSSQKDVDLEKRGENINVEKVPDDEEDAIPEPDEGEQDAIPEPEEGDRDAIPEPE